MSEQTLCANLLQIATSVEVCLEKRLITPALILLYSGIDTVGWLNSEFPYSSRESFAEWVDQYLLVAKQLPCNSLDLYAARCGILHTLTADSRLSADSRARRVLYAWGTAGTKALENAVESSGKSSECVVLHIDDLYEAWRLGVSVFLDELATDSAKSARVYKKAARFFVNLPKESLERSDTDV